MNQKISVFIITLNENQNIARCLEKLFWADEIIIVDSGSSDETVQIGLLYKAKIIFHKFENFGKQKQFALSQTKNDWVLSIDADEVLSDSLVNEIQNTVFTSEFVGYTIPRTHVFLGKVFKFGTENKRPVLRLFNKKNGFFIENKVHETVIAQGKTRSYENEMLHYTSEDVTKGISKCVNYALLSGEFMFEKGKRTYFIKLLFKFPLEFIKVYLFNRNFLNGYQGFVWSMFSALGSFLKYVKLWELQRKSIHSPAPGIHS
ncbi:glycosyltransferase family 2 protein [Flavobacterium sp. CHNK8]|uniref:glycosyltransferase family 2 protein n=1 Tax=Flavobacterium sp. CHNK8 TaxID=2871165 RepID=UPI001C8EEC63|nr:glycosyltransferase family 2 protein [Flavobacterium sp. CHNK8]QZK90783.1 glycosyltransferase family 2 protein [Flavobacterium sp. CHNK8]